MVAHEDALYFTKIGEGFYSFLSSVFNSAPKEKHLSLLSDTDVRDMFQQLSPESIPYFELPGNLEFIRQDFNDLFMVPGEKYVTPYESVYVDELRSEGSSNKKLLMGPSTMNVKKFYEKAGFKLSEKNIELPDFAGVEIQFVAELLKAERIHLENGESGEATAVKNLRQEFLKSHLGRWIEPLCNKIFENAESDFYKGIALFTKRIILQDIDDLG